MHQKEAALKWMTNLDYVQKRRVEGKMPRNQRPPVMNNKTVWLRLQSGNDHEINNGLITMHLSAHEADLYMPLGVPALAMLSMGLMKDE